MAHEHTAFVGDAPGMALTPCHPPGQFCCAYHSLVHGTECENRGTQLRFRVSQGEFWGQ
jgi:hypothetical protein